MSPDALGSRGAHSALCIAIGAGFTASELARQVRLLSNQAESEYGARRAAYDLKKLRLKIRVPIREQDYQEEELE